jgi:hypothetical protein
LRVIIACSPTAVAFFVGDGVYTAVFIKHSAIDGICAAMILCVGVPGRQKATHDKPSSRNDHL